MRWNLSHQCSSYLSAWECWASSLLPYYMAQAIQLVALTQVWEAMMDRSTNIYMDSRFAFGVFHVTGALWKQQGFLISTGHQIAHAALVAKLLKALQLPSAIAIVHCKTHRRMTPRSLDIINMQTTLPHNKSKHQDSLPRFLRNRRGRIMDRKIWSNLSGKTLVRPRWESHYLPLAPKTHMLAIAF